MFDCTNIFKILYNPKEAFKTLSKKANLMEGFLVAIFASIIMYAASLYMGSIFDIVSLVVTILLTLLTLVITSVVVAYLAGFMGGKKDINKTMALFGYAHVLLFLSTIIWLLVFIFLGDAMPTSIITTAGMTQMLTGVYLPIFIIALVFSIWGLWIDSVAVADANKLSFGKSVIAFIIAMIVYTILLVPISFLIPA